MPGTFRFSFGPWNIHEGADPFGPPVRPAVNFADKLPLYKKLGFDGVQFHDDDAVPNLNTLSPAQVEQTARELAKILDGEGLVAEFVAPRLWEDPRTIDGGFTSNDPAERQYAIDRTKQCIDIARTLGTSGVVYPAAALPQKAKESGATVIEINPGESAYFGVADIRLQGKTGEILPRIIEKIRNA